MAAYGGGTGISVPLPLRSVGLPPYLELGLLYKVRLLPEHRGESSSAWLCAPTLSRIPLSANHHGIVPKSFPASEILQLLRGDSGRDPHIARTLTSIFSYNRHVDRILPYTDE